MSEPVTLTAIKDFFGYADIASFRNDWLQLSAKDKEEIRKGFDDGTMTY